MRASGTVGCGLRHEMGCGDPQHALPYIHRRRKVTRVSDPDVRGTMTVTIRVDGFDYPVTVTHEWVEVDTGKPKDRM